MSNLETFIHAAEEVAENPDDMFTLFTAIIESGDREQLLFLQQYFTNVNEMIQMRLDSMPED